MFSMTFIRFSMQLGPAAMPRVLNSIVGQLTGIFPNPDLPVIPEMKLKPLIPQSAAERKRLLEDTSKFRVILAILSQSHAPKNSWVTSRMSSSSGF